MFEVLLPYIITFLVSMVPIVELRGEEQTGDDTSAITIYMKRGVNIETERHLEDYTTLIGVDEHYVAALTDESKVVLAKFKA